MIFIFPRAWGISRFIRVKLIIHKLKIELNAKTAVYDKE